MPSSPSKSSNHRKNRMKGGIKLVSEKSSSFHGRDVDHINTLPRLRTVPELLSGSRTIDDKRASSNYSMRPTTTSTKLLLNVTVERSIGPVHVIIEQFATVQDLIAATLRQYTKELRHPILSITDHRGFDLHYSQFSLECLEREEKLSELGSRNFFLCPKDRDGAFITWCSKEIDSKKGGGALFVRIWHVGRGGLFGTLFIMMKNLSHARLFSVGDILLKIWTQDCDNSL